MPSTAGRLSKMKVAECYLGMSTWKSLGLCRVEIGWSGWAGLDWRRLKGELEIEEMESNIWRNLDVEKS